MTRIIAGAAGSLALQVPKAGTRPTSDRVREAVFSAIESRGGCNGISVLDLYAGSGALGLEAVSRGAAEAVLVESNANAARTIAKNAAGVKEALARASAGTRDPFKPRIEVVTKAVQAYLRAAPVVPGAGFDLVFIDPPYELGEAELAEALVALAPLLAPEATVLVERSTRSPEPAWPTGLEPDRSKAYGETTLWWASTP